ncbi:hypothetical protein N9Y92_00515 [Chlamydiales bacterium]|nr:hypothetical protein [Chlamydiales bacterium]
MPRINNHEMITSYLEKVSYWLDRFEISRDVDHLDKAEQHAEVVREYSPKGFHELGVIELRNMYHCFPSLYCGDGNK